MLRATATARRRASCEFCALSFAMLRRAVESMSPSTPHSIAHFLSSSSCSAIRRSRIMTSVSPWCLSEGSTNKYNQGTYFGGRGANWRWSVSVVWCRWVIFWHSYWFEFWEGEGRHGRRGVLHQRKRTLVVDIQDWSMKTHQRNHATNVSHCPCPWSCKVCCRTPGP